MAKMNLEVKVTEMPKVKKIIADLIEENERLRKFIKEATPQCYHKDDPIWGNNGMIQEIKEALEK